MSLDSIQLPSRPSIRLRILPAHWKTHRMPLPDIAPDHPLVRDILPHLSLQVRFDPQPTQRVRTFCFVPREWRGRHVQFFEVRAYARQALERRRRWWGWLECGRREGRAGRDGRGGRRREEGGDGGHLCRRQLADATGVVDLEASADAAGGVTTYSVETCQGVLWGRGHL